MTEKFMGYAALVLGLAACTAAASIVVALAVFVWRWALR